MRWYIVTLVYCHFGIVHWGAKTKYYWRVEYTKLKQRRGEERRGEESRVEFHILERGRAWPPLPAPSSAAPGAPQPCAPRGAPHVTTAAGRTGPGRNDGRRRGPAPWRVSTRRIWHGGRCPCSRIWWCIYRSRPAHSRRHSREPGECVPQDEPRTFYIRGVYSQDFAAVAVERSSYVRAWSSTLVCRPLTTRLTEQRRNAFTKAQSMQLSLESECVP